MTEMGSPMRTKIAVLFLTATILGGCGMLGGGEAPGTQTASAPIPAKTVKLNTECARLQPLFAEGAGELTRADMDAALKVSYARWDKDGSGGLSNSEIQPINDELRTENVGASPVRDWNADGVVDLKEFGSGWRTMFELCDRNGNEKVSFAELGHSPNVSPPRAAPAAPKKDKPDGQTQQPGSGGY